LNNALLDGRQKIYIKRSNAIQKKVRIERIRSGTGKIEMIWCNCHQFQKTPKKIETENNIRSGQLHHHHQIINILENDDITTLFRGHSRFSTVFLELAQRMVHFLVFEIFRFHFGWPRKSVIKKSKPKNHFQNDSLFSKN